MGAGGHGGAGEAGAEGAVGPAWLLDGRADGVAGETLHASYLHVHWAGHPRLAQRFAERLLEEGIYAIGFFFPVVAKGQARIRTQMSAAHTREHLDRAIDAFIRIGHELGVVKA